MKSRLVTKPAPAQRGGVGKREANRRLTSLGLSRHHPDDVVNKALAIVERFRQWTGRQPCAVTGWRRHETRTWEGQVYRVWVEWAHVLRTRGAWSSDFGITLPLFDVLHRVQERTPDFFTSRGIDSEARARAHAIRFFREHSDDARWMAEHANDVTVITLATEALGEFAVTHPRSA